MQEALDAYRLELQKDEHERRGARKIADIFGVNYRTLTRLASGSTSMSTFNASKQKLSPAEERVLVDFILESADRGFPLSHPEIVLIANTLIQERATLGEPVGENWAPRFLDRHRDELQTHWSRPLDGQRAQALNPEVVKRWHKLVEEHVVRAGIRKEDIYGMDETGFQPSNQGVQRVVGRHGTKTQHKQGGANRENVTALVTICADGTIIQPTIIFKGANFMNKWNEGNVANAS